MSGTPKLQDLLREAGSRSSTPNGEPKEHGEAFRALYDGWVEQGGYQRGKPRRSVRQIKVWLGKNHEVRSIETKFAGKTPMQRQDVANLVWLFLQRWSYDEDTGEDHPYPYDNLDDLVETLTDEIYVPNTNGRATGLRLPRRGVSIDDEEEPASAPPSPATSNGSAPHPSFASTLPSSDRIVELYRDTDALITVSQQRTFIGADPGATMVGFHRLMDRLRVIDEDPKDKRFRALIWIVDLGRREGDPSSQSALHNCDFLATQIRSLLLTTDQARKDRAAWFLQRAVVLAGTLRIAEIDRLYCDLDVDIVPAEENEKDWTTPDRMFFAGLPDLWTQQVVRIDPSVLPERTITAHRDLTVAKTELPGQEGWKDLQFLFHMPLMSPHRKLQARCIDLPRPGVRWSDGMRMAHEAGLLRLGRRPRTDLPFSPAEGLRLLRDHRFAVLTAREFCQLSDQLAFEDFN